MNQQDNLSNSTDDVHLMQRLAEGDMSALAELIHRHQDKVLALALRTLRRPDVAEDVAQDVFVKVYHAAKSYKPTARFTTWLYRIVVNRCLDIMRKNRKLRGLSDSAPPPMDHRRGDWHIEQTEQAQLIRQAVDQLPHRQKMVVVLHRFQGLSHKEIAESTGWSTSAIESLLTRAYKSLRKPLAKLIQ